MQIQCITAHALSWQQYQAAERETQGGQILANRCKSALARVSGEVYAIPDADGHFTIDSTRQHELVHFRLTNIRSTCMLR